MSKAEELEYRQKRCPHGWVDESQCEHCKDIAELRRLAAENAQLKAELEAIYSTEPVAWMRDDGEEGSLSTMTVCCSEKVKALWLKCSPVQVERYTLPLIPLPVRKS